jgi:FKBP-type peptidyl-prolyl cis-trans isomerase FkpA
MKKLSLKEWVAVGAGVLFVGYSLFGGDIMNLFNRNMTNQNETAAAVNSNVNGVIINDINVGSGEELVMGKRATLHYILSLSDGTTIQNSRDFGTPFSFTLGVDKLIPGWEQGVLGMKEGGVRTIVIPPELGYGAAGQGPVPPNATLVFTIELLSVE